MGTTVSRLSIAVGLPLLAAALACSSARSAGDQAPSTGPLPVPADAAAAPPVDPNPLEPPDCADVGESTSPVVDGLDAVFDVYRCPPGGGPTILLNVRLTNRSDRPIKIDTRALPFPMLVFEVRDAAGDPVHGGPPPVPPADDPQRWRVELQPNADYLFDAALDGVIAIDVEPGDDEIRFVYEVATSDDGSWTGRLETGWIRFAIPPAQP